MAESGSPRNEALLSSASFESEGLAYAASRSRRGGVQYDGGAPLNERQNLEPVTSTSSVGTGSTDSDYLSRMSAVASERTRLHSVDSDICSDDSDYLSERSSTTSERSSDANERSSVASERSSAASETSTQEQNTKRSNPNEYPTDVFNSPRYSSPLVPTECGIWEKNLESAGLKPSLTEDLETHKLLMEENTTDIAPVSTSSTTATSTSSSSTTSTSTSSSTSTPSTTASS